MKKSNIAVTPMPYELELKCDQLHPMFVMCHVFSSLTGRPLFVAIKIVALPVGLIIGERLDIVVGGVVRDTRVEAKSRTFVVDKKGYVSGVTLVVESDQMGIRGAILKQKDIKVIQALFERDGWAIRF